MGREFSRYVLCHGVGSNTTLAFQQVGVISAGRVYGSIRTESLYLFSQARESDALQLRALALTPTGMFKTQAERGYRTALADFRAVACECIAGWACSHEQNRLKLDVPLSTNASCGTGNMRVLICLAGAVIVHFCVFSATWR